eukprot:maker-scaffold180_size281610-snap-gene-0.24 protein:Tk11861 transcript:maker-scaffold180_size281610-snap-gene-0.24-mRNA-1 annotation:"signal peptidase complex subunit 3"
MIEVNSQNSLDLLHAGIKPKDLLMTGLTNHQNVTLTLAWNVIPNAGNLPRAHASGSHSFKFPAEYATSRS